MRFESKHNYFKDLAHRVKCFKNIPKTMAQRHQEFVCYYMNSGSNCSPFLKENKTGTGESIYWHFNVLFFSMYICCTCTCMCLSTDLTHGSHFRPMYF